MNTPATSDKKTVTSLLLYFIVARSDQRRFTSIAGDIVKKYSVGGGLPRMETLEVDNDEIKVSFDFSSEINNLKKYNVSIEEIISAHENFTREMLAIDCRPMCHLSALISIDENLSVFGLVAPKIPNSINMFDNFSFGYSVWHFVKQA